MWTASTHYYYYFVSHIFNLSNGKFALDYLNGSPRDFHQHGLEERVGAQVDFLDRLLSSSDDYGVRQVADGHWGSRHPSSGRNSHNSTHTSEKQGLLHPLRFLRALLFELFKPKKLQALRGNSWPSCIIIIITRLAYVITLHNY